MTLDVTPSVISSNKLGAPVAAGEVANPVAEDVAGGVGGAVAAARTCSGPDHRSALRKVIPEFSAGDAADARGTAISRTELRSAW
jgi:hypothetical protein